MANANAEARQRWRERQKQKRLDALRLPDTRQDASLFRSRFFEAFQDDGNASNVEVGLDCAGIEFEIFSDDSGPKLGLKHQVQRLN